MGQRDASGLVEGCEQIAEGVFLVNTADGREGTISWEALWKHLLEVPRLRVGVIRRAWGWTWMATLAPEYVVRFAQGVASEVDVRMFVPDEPGSSDETWQIDERDGSIRCSETVWHAYVLPALQRYVSGNLVELRARRTA